MNHAIIEKNARKLDQTLIDFHISGECIGARPGPVVTQYEVQLGAGVKASHLTRIHLDIARQMCVEDCHITTQKGSPNIFVEIPNDSPEVVELARLLGSDREGTLPVCLGVDAVGQPLWIDLASAPHVLVAGTTGSGKSVLLHNVILSLAMTNSPNRVKFAMVDPKRVEFQMYENLPHLASRIRTENDEILSELVWLNAEMRRRYQLMSDIGARNIAAYNSRVEESEQLPYLVLIVDEMADLMLTNGEEVEECIVQMAQLSRAAGIHMVLATQRPSADVITGLIKANIPTRIAMRVASNIDSRVILDTSGAETLLGNGDMLVRFKNQTVRAHAAYVSDDELTQMIKAITDKWPNSFNVELIRQLRYLIERDDNRVIEYLARRLDVNKEVVDRVMREYKLG